MVRVLILRRQRFGGIATLTRDLERSLWDRNIDLVVDDADDWIPDKTGWMVDRDVSRKVRDAARGFDVVHAWAYRAAWACSEALTGKMRWMYTAYDLPRTTQPAFTERISTAYAGLASSEAVRFALEEAQVTRVRTVVPGILVPTDLPTPEEARASLGLDPETTLIVGAGRFGADSGLDALAAAGAELAEMNPDFLTVIAGAGAGHEGLARAGVRVETVIALPWVWLQAAHVVVVPVRRAGFSLTLAAAMALGKPVVARSLPALRELAIPDVSAEFFQDDAELGDALGSVLGADLYRETLGSAARIRAEERLGWDRYVDEMVAMYHAAAGR